MQFVSVFTVNVARHNRVTYHWAVTQTWQHEPKQVGGSLACLVLQQRRPIAIEDTFEVLVILRPQGLNQF